MAEGERRVSALENALPLKYSKHCIAGAPPICCRSTVVLAVVFVGVIHRTVISERFGKKGG